MSDQKRSVVSDYVQQQVAKEMAPLYATFGKGPTSAACHVCNSEPWQRHADYCSVSPEPDASKRHVIPKTADLAAAIKALANVAHAGMPVSVSAEMADAIGDCLNKLHYLESTAPVRATESTKGWLEAAIAWTVCASVHRKYAARKDALYTTSQGDYTRHADEARAKVQSILPPSGETTPPFEVHALKDHERRDLVGALTSVAKEYAGTQQLRERIAGVLLDYVPKVKTSQGNLAGFVQNGQLTRSYVPSGYTGNIYLDPKYTKAT